jgi:hypothetical protein
MGMQVLCVSWAKKGDPMQNYGLALMNGGAVHDGSSQVRWHPFQLNPNAPKEGVKKLDFYKKKFGDARIAPILDRISKVCALLYLPSPL